ncbi:membrane protein [Streptomyces sp. NRRL B-1140]|uniref:anthrone oxygenase family protein n=1 Tax=Streptomyces sp. NRRL B-1140 TaxID=1415549 RepID=UPI0006AE64F6|nr:anthrone oxygenase family protein [Streptomyces sp. NRRL B-1140]KOV99379.1 membrane protein [Streptomyces sp. NRRL B-1140]
MIDGPYFVLTVLGVLGTGLVAGVFCGFSTFVMRGLGTLPPAQGVAAMNAINAAAVAPPFMIVFLGSAALCAVIAVVTFVLWPDEGTVELLVGSALYLFGSLGLTMVANVPRNDALAGLEPDTPPAAAYWAAYLREWTLWNHIRTAASAGAALAYVLALT